MKLQTAVGLDRLITLGMMGYCVYWAFQEGHTHYALLFGFLLWWKYISEKRRFIEGASRAFASSIEFRALTKCAKDKNKAG